MQSYHLYPIFAIGKYSFNLLLYYVQIFVKYNILSIFIIYTYIIGQK